MLFVRSLNGGISHHPDELSSAEDIALAVDALTAALGRLVSMSEREVDDAGTTSAPARASSREAVADDGYQPDMILGIARGGLLVAGALGYALGVKNTFTMNVEFYTGIDERLDMPMILPPVPDLVDFAETQGADRRRRRRHRRDARARAGVLRRARSPRCGAPCSTRSRARRSSASTSGAAPTAGSRSRGAPKSPSCRRFPQTGLDVAPEGRIDSALPPGNPAFKERSTLTKRKLALGAILLVIAAAAVVLAVGTSPGSAKSNATFKAAWIYVGPHNDGGWSQAHDQGRLYVQKALGSKVQTTYKENVPEGPQVAQVIDSLVRDGNKIIFATSFGFQHAMAAAAKKYPDVKFEMATGYDQSEEHGRVLRRRRGRDLPLRHRRRRGDEDRHRRLRRPVRDPRGDPAHERVHARRAEGASRARR